MQVRSSGPTDAKIMIVGEAPGADEVQRGEPFVGVSGMELSKMLHEAGIMRSACFLTNVARERPLGNDIGDFIAFKKKDIGPYHGPLRDKMVKPVLREGYDLLKREIELVKPNLIIALGNVAMWALTGKWGIVEWRGSELWCDQIRFADGTSPKVIPTYHPTAIFRQWSLRQVAVMDLRKASGMAADRIIAKPAYNFDIRPAFGPALARLWKLQCDADFTKLKLSIDIETRAGHIACIGIAWSKLDCLCIPFMAIESEAGYWKEEEEFQLIFALRELMQHPGVQIIGQNFSYDAQYIARHWGFLPEAHFDTMLGQHALFSNMPKSLGFLSSLYCEHHLYWKDDGKTWDKNTGEEQLWVYNCMDCVRTYEIAETLIAVTAALGMEKVQEFQQSLFTPVNRTMLRGVKIDAAKREKFAGELQEAIAEREVWLHEILGYTINPNSPKQMFNLFVDELKQKPHLKRRVKGEYTPSFDEEGLTKLAERECLLRPIVNCIGEIRSLRVFFSTFVSAPLDYDGRMRCSYNIAGTTTYRFSSSETAFGSGTNLQNVPSGDETSDFRLPNVRKLFIPDDGYEFFDIDLDSADLRIVTWESGCKGMKELFAAGLKPYVEVAKEFYHDPTITKHHKSYAQFKSLCHATNYLGEAAGVAPRVGLLVHEVDRIQRWYFGRFPEIRAWQARLIAQINSRRFVQNGWGYRLNIFDRIDQTTYRECVAWIPQSSVGILINHVYAKIHTNLPKVEVLLQVHDSLAGQYPTMTGVDYKALILQQAAIPIPYDDPLIIPVGIKTSRDSWGDCK